MSHFSSTRTTWTPGTALLAGEMADLDIKTFKAINGDDGGTWAPASPITVGGAGMTLTLVGVNTAEGFYITGTFEAELGSNSYFRGSTSFRDGSDTSVRDGASWYFNDGSHTTFYPGSFLTVQGTAAFSGTMTADFIGASTVQISDSLTTATDSVTNLGGSLTVSQVANFYDTAHFRAATIVDGTMSLTGAGAIQERVVVGSNSDSTYSVSTADLVYIPFNGVSAARTYYLDEAGATNGKKIRFHREDNHSDRPIQLKRTSDGSLITLLNWSIGGQIWTDVQRISGVWQRVGGTFWS